MRLSVLNRHFIFQLLDPTIHKAQRNNGSGNWSTFMLVYGCTQRLFINGQAINAPMQFIMQCSQASRLGLRA